MNKIYDFSAGEYANSNKILKRSSEQIFIVSSNSLSKNI